MDILGIDIGGSGIKGAPVNVEQGCLQADRLRLPTPQPATPDAVVRAILQIVKHFSWTGPIGCGLPAVVQHGVARTAANIDPAWIGFNAQQQLSHATGCKVHVINDADVAGIAESSSRPASCRSRRHWPRNGFISKRHIISEYGTGPYYDGKNGSRDLCLGCCS